MKEIKGLVIEDFQSHRFTQVEFSSGFNVIVGATDQGKSAIIRALKWLMFNEPRGADFIRAGVSSCRVTALLANGVQVTRERTASRNRYYLQAPGGGEEVYEGFGNKVPQEIQVALGVGKVLLDENLETVLNLGEQLEAPFLLAETGSVKAKALGRLYGVHIVDAALRDTIRDLGRCHQEKRRLERHLDEVADNLTRYHDLPEMAVQLEKVRSKLTHSKKRGQRLEQISILKEELAVVGSHFEQAQTLVRLLGTVVRVEQLLGRLEKAVGELNNVKYLRQELAEAQGHLEQAWAVLATTSSLAHGEEVVGKVVQAARELDNLQTLQMELAKAEDGLKESQKILAGTGALAAASQDLEQALGCQSRGVEVAQLYRDYRQVQQAINWATETKQATAGIEKVSDVLAEFQERTMVLKKLSDLAQELKGCQTDLVTARGQVQRAKSSLQEHVHQYGQLLERLGKCPLCLSDIDPTIIQGILGQYSEEVQANGV